jgi:DNA processing protein
MLNSLKNTISPYEEMIAYEALWSQQNQSLKTLSELFKRDRSLPSQILQRDLFGDDINRVKEFLKSKSGFSVAIHGDFQYPQKLRSAKYPLELFYYKGDIGLLERRCISIVGSRQCTKDGIKRTKKLVVELVKRNFVIVSGIAIGIDTVALETAIKENGQVVGVIGTPIDQYYPPENKELQDTIAKNHLLISQVPFYRYSVEPFPSRRNYFPQRNETMSALSEATVIIEASDTSGTLTQARAALQQKRKLFILNSCFENTSIKWPHTYADRGAIRVRNTNDIISHLKT